MNRYIISFLFSLLGMCLSFAQTVMTDKKTKAVDGHLQKLDGVASVVGSFVILDSDIKRAFAEMQSQGISIKEMTNCKVLNRLMEDKLYAHRAIQDSIVVGDAEIEGYVKQQLNYSLQQFDNDMDKLLEFYKKGSEKDLMDELREIHKTLQLSQRMQAKITEKIKVTPEEVRQFFNKIIKDDSPYFGTELEISQIIIKPEIPKDETDKVVERLLKMKEDIEENGASFASKALLYSQDPASRPRGGLYTITKKSPMVQEFKDVAFSLQEGEISEPFDTEYGWHIMTVDKIRGKEYDVRHILLIPEATSEALTQAYEKIRTLRRRIIDSEITFEKAAREFSDEKETRYNDGKLINPKTLDTKFELTKIDTSLYSQIENLRDGEISAPLVDESASGGKSYKIIKIANRIDGHQADFRKDYDKIQQLALQEKKIKIIQSWVKDKINTTYVYVSKDYKICDFSENWLKK